METSQQEVISKSSSETCQVKNASQTEEAAFTKLCIIKKGHRIFKVQQVFSSRSLF